MDAGDGGSDPCLAQNNATCDQMSACDPTGLKLVFGDVTTCKAVGAQNCAATAIPDTNGLTDPAACLAAITASCDSYFETLDHPPAACRPKAGTLTGAGCGYDQQCVAGDVCDLSMASNPAPMCMKGTCSPAVTGTTMCNANTDCDSVKGGLQCVPTASGMPPMSDGMSVCQAPTYGQSGATCLAGSNLQCQVAFYCGPNGTCVQKLGAMQPCNIGDGSCDDRIHLTCALPQGGSATACTPLAVVPSGAQCGAGTTNLCAGNTYCDTTTTPSTCKLKVTQGNGCVTTLNGECANGLVCSPMTSTCEPPPPPACM
jgi:hypothetical protein